MLEDKRYFDILYQGLYFKGKVGFDVNNVSEVLLKLLELEAPVMRKPAERLHKYATHITARDPDGRTVKIHQREKKPA